MTNRCVKCWKAFEADYKANVCNGCTSVVPGFPTFKPGLMDSRVLGKGDWARRMTKAEEMEIKSARAVPIGNGKFATGRYENGKIREKAPRN